MDKKVKLAFSKVKDDYSKIFFEIESIKSNVNNIYKNSKLSLEIEEQLKRLDKIDLEKFVINMEKEFR